MKFLSNILVKAGLVVEGTADFQGTSNALTVNLSDSSTKIATTAFVKGQGYLTGSSPLSWANVTGTPTTLAGYGIIDPIVLTSGSYANPSWITALAWSKITGTPTTLSGYGITDSAPSNRTITINGTTYDLSADRSWSVGTVTSVGLSVPTGFSIGSSPVTGSGTLALTFASGYSLPTNAKQANWDTAYENRITSLTTTGTSGAASLVSNVLNIPIYQAQGNYITSLTGEATASGPGAAGVTLSTSAVTGKILTGLNLTGGGTISSTDSILTAFGKVQNQISGLFGGVTFQGVWNANTNSPALTSSVGTKGYYYIVDVAGSTNLNGITDWRIGDWAIFNGSTWDKVDNTDAVSSVNGFTGAVSLTTANISEVTNLYYTEARVNANANVAANTAARHNAVTIGTANGLSLSTQVLSLGLAGSGSTGALSSTDWNTFNNKQNILTLTTTGTSGAATLVGATLNIPNYAPDLSGYVPTSRTITINGTSQDLSANRTFNVGTVTSVSGTGTVSGLTLSGTVTSTGNLTLGGTLSLTAANVNAVGAITNNTSGTAANITATSNSTLTTLSALSLPYSQLTGTPSLSGFVTSVTASSPLASSGGTTPNISITQANGSTNGFLSSTDWTTFNSKQNALTNPVTGTGTTNYLPKFTGSTTVGNSQIFNNGTNVLVNTTTVGVNGLLQVNGSIGLRGNTQIRQATNADGNTLQIFATQIVAGLINSSSYNYTGGALIASVAAGDSFTLFDAGRNTLTDGRVKVINTTSGNTSLTVEKNGVYTLIASTAGNVLIGTATDNGSRLQVSGAATFSSSVTAAGNAATNPSFIANNPSGASGTAQHYIDFTAGATTIARMLRGNGASGLVGNGLNIDNFDGFGIRLNQLGGSGGNFIVTGGNVGIGTTSPSYKLDVLGVGQFKASTTSIADLLILYNTEASSAGVRQKFQNGYGDLAAISVSQRDNGALADDGQMQFQVASNSSLDTKMTILNTGNVGIGTTSPASLLDVRSANTSGATGATIRVGSQNHGGSGDEFANLEFFWGDPDYAEVKTKIYAKNTGNVGPGGGGAADLLFATRPAFGSLSEVMRITSGGNLLLGTTTDIGTKLLVNGTTYTAGFSANATAFQGNVTMNTGTTYIYNASSGSHTFTLQSASGSNQVFIVKNHTARSLTIATTGGQAIIDNAGASTTTFTLAANKAMIIQQDGGSTNYIISIY